MAGPSRDKTRSLALFLPLSGLFFLMPPAVLAFSMPASIAGVPIIILYIFAVWGFLIIGAAWLAHRLAARPGPETPLLPPVADERSPLGQDRAD